MKNKISRKNFIKNCATTVGLLTVGIPDIFADTNRQNSSVYTKESNENNVEHSALRGSWVRHGVPQKGDLTMQNCAIVVNKNSHTSVQQAALFLAADIEKISGHRPAITNQANNNQVNIHLVTSWNKALPKRIKQSELKNKWEAFRILSDKNAVYLVGSDDRGTAFAAYTLSERLGIDPLYLWTGYQPLKNTSLTLKKTDYYAPSPTVKYRGFFHDDEDVLPRPFDKYDYPLRIGDVPLEWYQRFFETALRLRMNMVAPYVRVHRRYEVQKCASDWGLFFTSHHYDILLSNPFGIERFNLAKKRGVSTDWDWFNNKENMLKYWRGGVEENKELDCIWPIGLRGTDDHAYEFPKNISEKEQANVFSEAIDLQIKTVKSIVKSNQAPAFHFTIYTEMLDKYNNHREDFNLPEEAILVWPDNNDGIMRALPEDKGKWKHGVYYHLAYFGGSPTKQGTHVITPMRVAEQFKNILNAGADEFMLVNVSELREHIMEARFIAHICSDATSALKDADPAGAYVNWWTNEYFGVDAKEMVAKAYYNYYNLITTSDSTYFGATMVEDILENIYQKLNGKAYKMPATDKIERLKVRNKGYQDAIAFNAKATEKLTREQKQFFFEHVEFGLLCDFRPTQAALILLQALAETAESKIWNLTAQAMEPLEKLEMEISRAERPPFEKWYRETWIKTSISPFNLHRSYQQLREFLSTGGKDSPIKPRIKLGHNIEGAKLWNQYMEGAEKINPSY